MKFFSEGFEAEIRLQAKNQLHWIILERILFFELRLEIFKSTFGQLCSPDFRFFAAYMCKNV